MFTQQSTELHLNASTNSFESYVVRDVSRNVFGGVQGRRLSEDNGKDDDDLSLPSTPELLDLCFEIEKQLSSEEILPEAPRASPLMAQEVLDALEGRETSSSGIRPQDALQANIEEGYEGAYPTFHSRTS
ncbi:hypothetical protein Emed_003916 [Eimeria media]